MYDQRELVHRQIERLVGIGRDLDREIVGTQQHRILGDQPLRRLHAEPGAGG